MSRRGDMGKGKGKEKGKEKEKEKEKEGVGNGKGKEKGQGKMRGTPPTTSNPRPASNQKPPLIKTQDGQNNKREGKGKGKVKGKEKMEEEVKEESMLEWTDFVKQDPTPPRRSESLLLPLLLLLSFPSCIYV